MKDNVFFRGGKEYGYLPKGTKALRLTKNFLRETWCPRVFVAKGTCQAEKGAHVILPETLNFKL
jgi:hypothetical protein